MFNFRKLLAQFFICNKDYFLEVDIAGFLISLIAYNEKNSFMLIIYAA